ncbi:MAG: AAA family ATPase [Rubrivivax sp.]|nr:AAA family ATPase [Rubrivivax sp.]
MAAVMRRTGLRRPKRCELWGSARPARLSIGDGPCEAKGGGAAGHRIDMLTLQLLGVPQLARKDGTAAVALERKDAAWLAMLAFDGPSPRDRLATWLWPAVAQKTANGSLRQRIFRLRRKLGHEIVDAGERIQLLPEVSYSCFEDDPLLMQGAALLSGMDYTECADFAQWLAHQQQRRQHAYRKGLEALAQRHESQGRLREAVAACRRWCDDDPLSEQAACRLMELLYLSGDRAAAIAEFERLERFLKDELSARPQASTLRLLDLLEAGRHPDLPRPAGVPLALKRPPRLIGREQQMAALSQAWALGHVAWIQAPPGAGKTRLIEEFARTHAESGWFVQARPGDQGVPYAVLLRWVECLHKRVPLPDTGRPLALWLKSERSDQPAPSPAALHPVSLRQEMETWLEAAQPIASSTVLDDLQWADPASLDLLSALIFSDRTQAMRWACSMRNDEPDSAPVSALKARLSQACLLQNIELTAWTPAEMSQLLDSLALPGLSGEPLATRLHRHVGGEPLFALETLKSLSVQALPYRPCDGPLPVPSTVRSMIESRLSALSPPALALAQAAAVAAADFSIDLATHALSTSAIALSAPWRELEAAQIFAGGGFAHDVLREVTRAEIPEPIARHAHGMVATWLAARGAQPARVAPHWQAAGCPEAAALSWSAAAKRARAGGRSAECLQFTEAGARAFSEIGDERRAVQLKLDNEAVFVRSLDAAQLRVWADDLVGSSVDDAQRCWACIIRGDIEAQLGLGPQAMAWAGRAEALLPPDDADLFLSARWAQLKGTAWIHMGELKKAVSLLEEWALKTRQTPLESRLIELPSTLAYALDAAGRTEEALAQYVRFGNLARQQGEHLWEQDSYSGRAVAQVLLGDLQGAVESQEKAIELARRHELSGLALAIDEQSLAAMYMEQGRFGEALNLLMPAQEALDRTSAETWANFAVDHLRLLWTLLGQRSRARQLLTPREADGGSELDLGQLHTLLRSALDFGDDVGLLAARVGEHGTQRLRARGQVALAITLARCEPPKAAAQSYRRIALQAREWQLPAYELNAQARCVQALLDSGQRDQAAELAAEVARDARQVHPYDLYVPQLWLSVADAFRATADLASAQKAEESGRSWVQRASASLPQSYREAFEQFNPINRALLTRA